MKKEEIMLKLNLIWKVNKKEFRIFIKWWEGWVAEMVLHRSIIIRIYRSGL